MANISKAERERRAAEKSAASADFVAAEAAPEQAAEPAITLVRMTRDPATNPPPHAVDVHPAEMANYALGGYQLAKD